MVTRKIVVNGREMTVRLSPDGSFQADGRTGSASIVQVENGVYSVILDGRNYEVRVQGQTLNIDGERFAVEVEDPRAARPAAGPNFEGRQTLRAAMPGKVVRLLVKEGDEVKAGQGILVVEAMKMQNEVKSPKAGRVSSIVIKEGAAVASGEALAVVE
jgi:biotin carboxyl carrier protein